MAKSNQLKKYPAAGEKVPKAEEPFTEYISIKKLPPVDNFSFRRFQKIADKVPFTQKEWAGILHLSERTLQRYAKDNSSFEGIYVDRILQLEQLINLGLRTFTSGDVFYNWLKRDKPVFGNRLNFESLYSHQGIMETYNQVGRILHNVYT